MPLIDTTYFVGELNIASLSKPAVQEQLNLLILQKERKYLEDLLGHDLYISFTEGIAETVIEQRWVNLRDGYSWLDEYNNRFNWVGFKNSETKKSPIANYIYYWYVRNNVTQTTAVGETKSETENSSIVSPAAKMCRAWNEMVEWNLELIRLLYLNTADYYPLYLQPVIYSGYGRRVYSNSLLNKINEFNL